MKLRGISNEGLRRIARAVKGQEDGKFDSAGDASTKSLWTTTYKDDETDVIVCEDCAKKYNFQVTDDTYA